jgi:hypothetical protein
MFFLRMFVCLFNASVRFCCSFFGFEETRPLEPSATTIRRRRRITAAAAAGDDVDDTREADALWSTIRTRRQKKR